MFFFFLSRNVSQLKLSPIISSANSLYMSASVSISSVHDIGNVMWCDSQFFAQIARQNRQKHYTFRAWMTIDRPPGLFTWKSAAIPFLRAIYNFASSFSDEKEKTTLLSERDKSHGWRSSRKKRKKVSGYTIKP